LALYRPIDARLRPPAASHSASSREYRLPAAVPPEAAIPFPETYRINSFYTASAASCPMRRPIPAVQDGINWPRAACDGSTMRRALKTHRPRQRKAAVTAGAASIPF
jgi:hypothetical protein